LENFKKKDSAQEKHVAKKRREFVHSLARGLSIQKMHQRVSKMVYLRRLILGVCSVVFCVRLDDHRGGYRILPFFFPRGE